MPRRLPIVILLGSALAFLASLYLPWRSAHGGGDLEGWVGVDGYVAALLALALVAGSAAALLRPPLAARVPLGGLGVGLAYFGAAVAVQLHAVFAGSPGPGPVLHYGWAHGFYLGAASGGLAGVAGVALRRREVFRRRSLADAAATILGAGLLVSFLLPWLTTVPGQPGVVGLDIAPATLAAVGIVFCAGPLLNAGAPLRLGAAVTAAVLTGAAATGIQHYTADRYGKWLGIGCAVALVALEASRARPARIPAAPSWPAALRAGAAALLLVALFLPALEYRFPQTDITTSGWQTTYGAVAGGLALLLLFAPLLPRVESYAIDAALGVALLVATIGISSAAAPISALRLGYGAYLDFSAAALLLLLALLRLRTVRLGGRGASAWPLPLTATAACLAAVLLPLWYVLPERWTLQATAVQGWFSMAALLIALYLARLWVLRLRGLPAGPRRLTLVPLALLALPALQLVRYRELAIVWGGVILVAFCLLLALLGWIEENGGGGGHLRMPELLRLDRLPGEG